MRKISKSHRIPATLQHAPIPTNVDEVDKTIYGADDVRRQLVEDQYDKCAYCECRIPLQYNDVEHYRPKSAYHWLGHDWSNLLYACNLCNRTYKKSHFPLLREADRDLDQQDISREIPLIINPTVEDPAAHITYNRYMMVPRVVDGIEDAKGKETIRLFHLNDEEERPTLVSSRKEVYESYELQKRIKQYAETVVNTPDVPECIRNQMREVLAETEIAMNSMKEPAAYFSGMLAELD